MAMPSSKEEIDQLEERGLWQASSFLHKKVGTAKKQNEPVRLEWIIKAHRIIFTIACAEGMAGRYRNSNGPELVRIDDTLLPIAGWEQISSLMAQLGDDVKAYTANLRPPMTRVAYKKLVVVAARLSHRLACIHPFENGNGRSSRLLMSAILMRAGLPDAPVNTDKPRYLKAMRCGDDGDFSALEEIIARGVVSAKRKEFLTRDRKRAQLAIVRRKKR